MDIQPREYGIIDHLANVNWRKKWMSLSDKCNYLPRVTIETDNTYEYWLNSLPDCWKRRVNFSSLNEMKGRMPVYKGITRNADCLIRGRYLFLVERELSKIEILSAECSFNKLIWLVNISPESQLREMHGIKLNSPNQTDFDSFRSKERYLKNYKTLLDSIPSQIQRLANSSYKSQDTFYKKKKADEIKDLETKAQKIRNHIFDISNGVINQEKWLFEDWDNCIDFPRLEQGLVRYKYTASPLILDDGKYLYIRKFAPSGIDTIEQPYLKRITHETFINWILQ
jgi:hypothetical protein